MDELWQTCPACGFTWAIAEDDLAETSLPYEQDAEGLVFCPDCGNAFEFDEDAPVAEY